MFITFEGVEGSGKTLQAGLLAEYLTGRGLPVLLTREPGGTGIGDQVRQVLHDVRNTAMLSTTEILLYSAARAQIVGEVVAPALKAGQVVVSDRYADSTLAYQGFGRGLDLAALRFITAFATGGLIPDLTIFLDVPVRLGLLRKQAAHRQESGEFNRMDRQSLEFYERVRTGYLVLAGEEPARWRVVNGEGEVPAIESEIRQLVTSQLNAGGWRL